MAAVLIMIALFHEKECGCHGLVAGLAAGDIKATRMVIYGALLGVLDPVLTLAAAAAGEVDGTRMPMMSSPLAAITRSSTDSGQSDGEGTGAAESSTDTGVSSRESFLDARSQREERRLQLAGSNTNDYAVTLAAYKVRICAARPCVEPQDEINPLFHPLQQHADAVFAFVVEPCWLTKRVLGLRL